MKYLSIIKFATKVLALTQISAFALSSESQINNDYEIIEGDIVVQKNHKKRSKRSLISTTGEFWENGKIYYSFDSRGNPHSEEEKNRIRSVMREYENEANIQFIEISDNYKIRSSYKSYVRITNIVGDLDTGVEAGCYATVGMYEGMNQLNLSSSYILEGDTFSCFSARDATIRHELLHIVGFAHEHSRPEQKQKIIINLNNARERYRQPKMLNNWNPLQSDYFTIDEYDFTSIMHYSSFSGASKEARLNNKPVITKLNGDLIPRNEILSASDKLALRRIYGSSPNKVVIDKDGNRVQYCKPYQLDYKILTSDVLSLRNSLNYVISSTDSRATIMNNVYDKSSVVIFEPADDTTLCSEKVKRLKEQNINIKLDVEKTDKVKIKFKNPDNNDKKYLELNNNKVLVFDEAKASLETSEFDFYCTEVSIENKCVYINEVVSKKFDSGNLALEAKYGSVAYIIPTQDNATGPTTLIWTDAGSYSGKTSDITVNLLNKETRSNEKVILTGRRLLLVDGMVNKMNAAVTSENLRVGNLEIYFDKKKNPDLKAGKYTGEFTVLAKGWHDSTFSKDLKIFVSIEQK